MKRGTRVKRRRRAAPSNLILTTLTIKIVSADSSGSKERTAADDALSRPDAAHLEGWMISRGALVVVLGGDVHGADVRGCGVPVPVAPHRVR
jgi:hypothetical protein